MIKIPRWRQKLGIPYLRDVAVMGIFCYRRSLYLVVLMASASSWGWSSNQRRAEEHLTTSSFLWSLILLGLTYLSVSKDWGGGGGEGHICPPLGILGLVWVRVPILFGNALPDSYLSYSKDFMKFGWPEHPQKIIDFSNFFIGHRGLRPSL